MAVALIGKFTLTGAFASIYLYSSELIPTEVRNIGMGLTSIGARLGGILAPMVLLMVRLYMCFLEWYIYCIHANV